MTRRNLTNDLTQLFLSLGPRLFCRAAQEWVGVGGTLHFQRLKTQSSSNTSLWVFVCLVRVGFLKYGLAMSPRLASNSGSPQASAS